MSKGLCFPYALQEGRERGGRVVHAIITPEAGRCFWHAWVERAGRVYDDADHRLTIRRFYALMNPTDVRKYNWHEAAIYALRTGHAGPWESGETGPRPKPPRRRDPPEKRKRPYERYAARTMSKLALRRLALQAISRPGVAQGPLHDTLLGMYFSYAEAIEDAERLVDKEPLAVVFALHRIGSPYPFNIYQWTEATEPRLNREAEERRKRQALTRVRSGPYVVTYIARPR